MNHNSRYLTVFLLFVHT